MSSTFRNIGIGASSGALKEPPAGCWDEEDRRARYDAVSDACWIYQYRDLEQNLRRFGPRQARRKVLAQGTLSREWVNRGRGDLRLTRGGLQMRFRSGVRTVDWKKQGVRRSAEVVRPSQRNVPRYPARRG